ncbi:MAG: AmmeMemoRadiSam system radical SAM enzyme [Bacteroidota bacterium]|nr:AmmeMemoRadiSam system radical SAM enzyme [Bacteroidota bacterium]
MMKNKYVYLTVGTIFLIGLIAGILLLSERSNNNKQSITRETPCKNKKIEASVCPAPEKNITRKMVEEHNLSMKEAMYYDKMGNSGEVVCRLCPHKCFLEEGEVGDCRVRANIEGKLRSLVYARPITMHIDPIEKKPFFHFHPKEKTLSIATAGCNLRCRNCQNWEISQLSPFEMEDVKVVPPKDVVKLAKRHGAEIISYTYNDPIVFYEYMLETAKIAQKNGIKNTMVTAGFINEEPMRELAKYMDAATVDIKGTSNEFYRKFNTGELDPVLDAIKVMHEEGLWLEISYLVIPGENDTKADFEKFANWVIDNIGDDTPVHFLRFFPHFQMKSKPATPIPTLEYARKTAQEAGLKHVYLGNVRNTDAEDTFCPHCGKKIIDRSGYLIRSFHVTPEGNCEYCGKPINGVWE